MIYRRIVGWVSGAASGGFLLVAVLNWIQCYCSRSNAATSGFFDSITNAVAAEMYRRDAIWATKWFVMATALSVICDISVRLLTKDVDGQLVCTELEKKKEAGDVGRAEPNNVAEESRATKNMVAVSVIFVVMVLGLLTISIFSISRDDFLLHVSSRQGVLSDNVLVVSNKSSTAIQRVKVDFDYADDSSKSEKVFNLKPNEVKELGAIQLLRRPKKGDKGCVSRMSEKGELFDSVKFELGENGGCRILR